MAVYNFEVTRTFPFLHIFFHLNSMIILRRRENNYSCAMSSSEKLRLRELGAMFNILWLEGTYTPHFALSLRLCLITFLIPLPALGALEMVINISSGEDNC